MRSLLDWGQIARLKPSVVEEFSRSRDLLGCLQTVWYVTPTGSRGDWREQSDRRLTVEEVAAMPDFPTAGGAAYIKTLKDEFDQSLGPSVVVLPTYRASDQTSIILDGNHRAVAAFQSKQEVRLLIFTINGPLDPLILPDLLHEVSIIEPESWSSKRQLIERHFKLGNAE